MEDGRVIRWSVCVLGEEEGKMKFVRKIRWKKEIKEVRARFRRESSVGTWTKKNKRTIQRKQRRTERDRELPFGGSSSRKEWREFSEKMWTLCNILCSSDRYKFSEISQLHSSIACGCTVYWLEVWACITFVAAPIWVGSRLCSYFLTSTVLFGNTSTDSSFLHQLTWNPRPASPFSFFSS